jgi:hypothetical protein
MGQTENLKRYKKIIIEMGAKIIQQLIKQEHDNEL